MQRTHAEMQQQPRCSTAAARKFDIHSTYRSLSGGLCTRAVAQTQPSGGAPQCGAVWAGAAGAAQTFAPAQVKSVKMADFLARVCAPGIEDPCRRRRHIWPSVWRPFFVHSPGRPAAHVRHWKFTGRGALRGHLLHRACRLANVPVVPAAAAPRTVASASWTLSRPRGPFQGSISAFSTAFDVNLSVLLTCRL